MESVELSAGRISRLGGRLCLDFANTADWHASDRPVEYLTSYADLVAWSQQSGVLTERNALQLHEAALRHPAEAVEVLERATALREAIYWIFSAASHGQPQSPRQLEALNAELTTMLARSGLVPASEGFSWGWKGAEAALDRMLWPVVHDAALLLTSNDLGRVGQCADDRCGWLFLDMSRNRSRRWCSMEDCGNRAKARRHYRRTQAKALDA